MGNRPFIIKRRVGFSSEDPLVAIIRVGPLGRRSGGQVVVAGEVHARDEEGEKRTTASLSKKMAVNTRTRKPMVDWGGSIS